MITLRNVEKFYEGGFGGAWTGEFEFVNHQVHRMKPRERAAAVCDTLDRFHIVGKRDLFPSQLSGGQQQLVAVARAVIANPKLILADGPTGNLHSSQGKEIMELFKKLNGEGTTIVQVTHSEANAPYGHRVIQLADGWIVRAGAAGGGVKG